MGRASQIVEACGELIEALKDGDASAATMLVELDRELDGWCFEITFRKVRPEDFEAESGEDSKP